ncbi:MAG: Glutaryl-CoA dehydrogenase, partial [uncultured Actinomycetospora sp.]
ARRDRAHRSVGQQLLRRAHRPRDGLDPRGRHRGAAAALAPVDGAHGDDRRVRAHRAPRRLRRRGRHGDHGDPRRGRVGARGRQALDRQRDHRRPHRDLGARRGDERRAWLRRARRHPGHDDHQDRGQDVAADRPERRHRPARRAGARRPPALRRLGHVRRRGRGPAAHAGQRVVGRGRHADGGLRARPVLRPAARAVRPADRRLPAHAGAARADAGQRHRLAGHGRAQRPAPRRGQGLRRALRAREGVLREPDARDRRVGPPAGGRQRRRAGQRRGAVLRRRGGAVLLRGHARDEHADRREADHRPQRVRAL